MVCSEGRYFYIYYYYYYYYYYGGNSSTALKVPWHCPLVLLVNAAWKEGKAIRTEKNVAWWKWIAGCMQHCKAAENLGWILCLEGSIMAEFWWRWEEYVLTETDVNVGGRLYEKREVRRGYRLLTQQCSRTEENRGKPYDSPQNIVFITKTGRVFFAVRTDSSNIIQINFSLQRI